MALAVALVLVACDAGSAPDPGFGFDACAAACGPIAELVIPLGADSESLAGCYAKVCHNDRCLEVDLTAAPTTGNGVGSGQSANGDGWSAQIFLVEDDGFSAQATLFASTIPVAGDTFSFSLTAEDTSVIEERLFAVASIREFSVRGRPCGSADLATP